MTKPMTDVLHVTKNFTVHIAPTHDSTLLEGTIVYKLRNTQTQVDEYETNLAYWAILMANELSENYDQLDRSMTASEYMKQTTEEHIYKQAVHSVYLDPDNKGNKAH